MFTKEQLELLNKLIDEKLAKDQEERKQAVERIIAHLDVIEESDKKRHGLLDALMKRVAKLEQPNQATN